MELCIDRLTKQYENKIAVDRVSLQLTNGVYGCLEQMAQENNLHAYALRDFETDRRYSNL